MPIEITRRRFDVHDYHRMAETGILSEDDRVELIDGEIVTMTPVGPKHNAAVDRATRALVTAVGDRAIVRVQGSVRLDRFHGPQPDLALLAPRPDFYASYLPGPSDILLVIEIAESSVDSDRHVKTTIYAESGVPEYWPVNLNGRVVLRHTHPREGAYQNVREYHSADAIPLPLLPECTIPADVLLVG